MSMSCPVSINIITMSEWEKHLSMSCPTTLNIFQCRNGGNIFRCHAREPSTSFNVGMVGNIFQCHALKYSTSFNVGETSFDVENILAMSLQPGTDHETSLRCRDNLGQVRPRQGEESVNTTPPHHPPFYPFASAGWEQGTVKVKSRSNVPFGNMS